MLQNCTGKDLFGIKKILMETLILITYMMKPNALGWAVQLAILPNAFLLITFLKSLLFQIVHFTTAKPDM